MELEVEVVDPRGEIWMNPLAGIDREWRESRCMVRGNVEWGKVCEAWVKWREEDK